LICKRPLHFPSGSKVGLGRVEDGSRLGQPSAPYCVPSWIAGRNCNCEGGLGVSTEGREGAEDASLQEIMAAARAPAARRGPRHSPLYEWLWTRHGTLAAELNPPRTPNWTAVAEGFAKLGVVDGKAQPPTPVVVRKTWTKVSRAKEVVALGGVPQRRKGRNPAAGIERPAPLTPGDAIPAAKLGMLPPGIEPPGEAPRRFTFQFASAKDWTKEADKGDE